MYLEDVKRWQWCAIGAIAGAIVGIGLTFIPPGRDPTIRKPISAEQFVAQVRKNALRNVIVTPAGRHDFVTGETLTGETNQPFAAYFDRPFIALDVNTASVNEFVRNAGFAYRNPWWRTSWFVITASAFLGMLSIGGVWPFVVHRAYFGTWCRPAGPKDEYEMNRLIAGLPIEENTPENVESPSLPAPEKSYRGEYYPVEVPPEESPDSHTHRTAFSIIELLVVLGVIAIVLSLLLPAIRRAGAQADVAVCANNLRQISTALQAYLNENDNVAFWRGADINLDGMDWYGYGGREARNANIDQYNYFNSATRPLNRYLGNKLEMFKCPHDDAAPWATQISQCDRAPDSQFDWVGNCYNFNANGYPLRPPPRHDSGLDGVKFTTIRDTSVTITFYEACLYWGADWHYAHKANIAFADGHVEFLPMPGWHGEMRWEP